VKLVVEKSLKQLEVEYVTSVMSPEEREWALRALRGELLDLESTLKSIGVYDRRWHKRNVLEESVAGSELVEGEGC
jgi:hypothetical protein